MAEVAGLAAHATYGTACGVRAPLRFCAAIKQAIDLVGGEVLAWPAGSS